MTAPLRPGIVRSIRDTAVAAAGGGVWIAAGALAPAGRRSARAAVLVVAGSLGLMQPRSVEPGPRVDPSLPTVADPTVTDPAGTTVHRARTVAGMIVVAVALEIGSVLVWRRVESRLLERLRRRGYTDPHAALGLRAAGVSFVIMMALDLIEPHSGARTTIEGREVLEPKETRAGR